MANKVKFNLKNVHIAPVTDSGYDTPFSLPGAVALSLSAEGDNEKFYADGTVYYQSFANNGYSGSLEIAMVTDEFRTKVLNETKDSSTKNMTESINNAPIDFALGFQIDGDDTETKFWFLKCSVSRPSVEAATLEGSKTPKTDTLNISCIADENGKVRVKSTAESTTTDWFSAVVAS